jgi:hypothetical protein
MSEEVYKCLNSMELYVASAKREYRLGREREGDSRAYNMKCARLDLKLAIEQAALALVEMAEEP